jgi:polysaccharide biosynthesis transport protein
MNRMRALPPNERGPNLPRKRRLVADPEDFWLPEVNAAGYAHSPNCVCNQESGLLEYWRILIQKKWTLLAFAAAGMLLAALFTKLQSPIYRARALLEIESLNEDFLNMRNVTPTAANENTQSPEYGIRTQLAVLQSEPVVERAIEKLNLEKRILAILQRPRLLAFPGSDAKPVPKHQAELLAHERLIITARNALRVRPQVNTRVLDLTFDSADPQIAADFANAIITAFTEVTLEYRWKSTQNTSEWLSRQLQDVKAKLERSQDELQRYARAENLTFLSETAATVDTAAEERLKQLQTQLSAAEAERIAKQSAYELATGAPAESLPEVLDNATLRDYSVQLTALRRQLADLSSAFTAQYPKVISLRAQISVLESALEKERQNIITRTRNEYNAALRREKLMEGDYSAVMGIKSAQAEKVSHYLLLKREVDTTRDLYDSMVQRVKEADLASAMRASDVHVIESAKPPQTPYKPVPLLNMAFGLLSGSFLGAGYVIQRARAYHGIQEPGDTTLELNVPELGVIPSTSVAAPQFRRLLGKSGGGRRRPELTTWQEAPSPIAEAFRLTLTSVLFSTSQGEVPPRVIALSSANPNEGKTTVISNLSIALASINRRVLLIDGDVRKRRLHRIFNVDNTRGLKEALEGDLTVSVQQTNIPNLFVLPSGRGGAKETLFFSSQFRQLLDRLVPEFDMVLIDTPPLLHVSDARLICHEADAVILVVAQHTARESVLHARQRLIDDGSRLLGSILNKWDPSTNVTAYRYGQYYRYKDYYQHESAN